MSMDEDKYNMNVHQHETHKNIRDKKMHELCVCVQLYLFKELSTRDISLKCS